MIDSERIVNLVADEYGILKAERNGVLEPILIDAPGTAYFGCLKLDASLGLIKENKTKTERED